MRYRLGLVMEESLGHGTHRRALAAHLASEPDVEPTWVDVPYHADDAWSRLPLVKDNWSLRGGLRARARLGRALRDRSLDGLLFHTQVAALCSRDLLRRLPSVVSLDATPRNLDSVGAAYGHRPEGQDPLGRLKRAWNGAVLRAATALAPWSEWARRSLIDDYGVPAERTVVIPPGVDLRAWRPGPRAGGGPARLLFVGGDFTRKGGHDLLAVLPEVAGCELDVVTGAAALPEPGPRVRVHRGLRAGDAALRRLFREADALVLPSRGECFGLVLLEAMASGLPVVATRVGAIPELVEDGVTGHLVAPGDRAALAGALRSLVASRAQRACMGRAARARAEARFDAARTYARLVALLRRCVDAARVRIPPRPEVVRVA